jgi:hypothetical protein
MKILAKMIQDIKFFGISKQNYLLLTGNPYSLIRLTSPSAFKEIGCGAVGSRRLGPHVIVCTLLGMHWVTM